MSRRPKEGDTTYTVRQSNGEQHRVARLSVRQRYYSYLFSKSEPLLRAHRASHDFLPPFRMESLQEINSLVTIYDQNYDTLRAGILRPKKAIGEYQRDI